jgi:hypothetical protein
LAQAQFEQRAHFEVRVRALDYFQLTDLGCNIKALAQIAGRGETLSLLERLAH